MTVNPLEQLTSQGFEKVTKWVLHNDRIKLASLDWPETSGWLYAFVAEDRDVKYIGLTERILRSRMDNYRDSKEEQGMRIRGLIMADLQSGKDVYVYGRRQAGSHDLHKDEIRYRRELDPPWNLV